ncbi:MAG: acetyl-CoA carboxylase biotin carboxyl carrier protein [Acidobacteria bacterium]|nr:acetyl-CoA carboxylase biotin carboxyl carrier protein [Acidobacteriota bacterium]
MKKIERKAKRTTSGGEKAAKPVSPRQQVATDSGDNLSLSEIKTLIELISDKQFNEFELERGNFRLRLSKGLSKPQVVSESAPIVEQRVVSAPLPVAAVAQPQAATVAAVAEPQPAKEEEKLHIVTSPIVGTFYGAPNPTAAPFVSVGDTVQAGKVLCIIEAMKLMNEIVSDASGVIAKIFVENGQPVEYGQALFGIKQ